MQQKPMSDDSTAGLPAATPSPEPAQSEHARFLSDLQHSGKTPEQVKAAWGEYYDGLTESDRLEVWQEHYERERTAAADAQAAAKSEADNAEQPKAEDGPVVAQLISEHKSFFSIRNQIRSLLFGLATGGAVVMVFMFILFNEIVISPFIRPSENVNLVPVADRAGVPADPSPKIRIPKINVEIPVVYGLPSTDAKQFELALDKGVVHYPTTALPGQAGNAAFFGHSSNNIFNPGKYKFAFVLLRELVNGDTFYLTHEGKLYTYEVISRRVVRPTEIGVLGPVAGQVATATLITCDPPGTSTNRLVVVGKQISPDPAGDAAPPPAAPEAAAPPPVDNLPGNGPGLLNRLYRAIF